jgi:signal transduction histidine kinase
MKVLIAEDDLISCRLLEATLGSFGYEVLTTTTGHDAWLVLQEANAPQLAILDLILPGIDGMELCRRVRASLEHRPRYLILLTSRNSKEDLVAGLEAGADDYLTKPFDAEELRARLHVGERILDLQKRLFDRERLQYELNERKRLEEMHLEFLNQLVKMQEEERHRIARELHDQMGQHLTALKLGLNSLKDPSFNQLSTNNQLIKLIDLTDQISKDVHRLAWELRPSVLDDLGLYNALQNYVEQWSEHTNINVDLQRIGLREERLSPEIETTLYRIVQEALNNILKYAETKHISVILEHHNNYAQMIIEDEGKGFDLDSILNTASMKGRLGILGMRERAALVGGTFDIESTVGVGTTIFVRIPTT